MTTTTASGSSRNRLRETALVIALFVIALAFRAPAISPPDAGMGGDEGEYHSLATRIMNGHGFTSVDGRPTAWRTPGFPAVLAGMYTIVGPSPAAARVILGIMSSLVAVLIYFLCKLLFQSRLIGFIAGVCWALLMTSLRMAPLLYGEETAALLWLLGLCLVVTAARRRSLPLVGLAGLVLGFAVLTRAYLLPALIGPALWLACLTDKKAIIVFVGSAALLVGLWMTRNALFLGSFSLSTQSAQGMWVGNNQWARGSWPGEWVQPDSQQKRYLEERHSGFLQMNEVDQARIFSIEAWNELTNHPKHILWLLPRKLFLYLSATNYLGTDWVYLFTFPFALVGSGFMLVSKRYRFDAILLGVPIVGVALVCLLTFGDSRFRHPLDPIMMIFASFGAVMMVQFLGRRLRTSS